MPQGSILGTDDSNLVIKYSEVHYFADETSLLNFNTWVKSINKLLSYDLKNLGNWSKANKIFLNAGKTEVVLFTSPKKQFDCDFKIKRNGNRLCEIDSVKYLLIQIDKYEHGNNRLIVLLLS